MYKYVSCSNYACKFSCRLDKKFSRKIKLKKLKEKINSLILKIPKLQTSFIKNKKVNFLPLFVCFDKEL